MNNKTTEKAQLRQRSSMTLLRLCRAIRWDIHERGLTPGSRYYTLRDIADKFDASLLSCQRAVDLLKKENILKTKPRSGIFTGKSLPSESLKVGVFMINPPRRDKLFYDEIFEGVTESSYSNDKISRIQLSSNITATQYNNILKTMLSEEIFDSLIIFGANLFPDTWLWLKNRGTPTVFMGPRFENTDFPHISTKFIDRMEDTFQRLKKLGHKRVMMYSNDHQTPRDIPESKCLNSFNSPLWSKSGGMKVSKRWSRLMKSMDMDQDEKLFRIMNDYSEDAAEEICKWYFSLSPVPTAMYLPQENLALEVIYRLRKNNIHIPEDLSIISQGSSHTPVDLTHWQVKAFDIGRAAFNLLIRQMQRPEKAIVESVDYFFNRGQTLAAASTNLKGNRDK